MSNSNKRKYHFDEKKEDIRNKKYKDTKDQLLFIKCDFETQKLIHIFSYGIWFTNILPSSLFVEFKKKANLLIITDRISVYSNLDEHHQKLYKVEKITDSIFSSILEMNEEKEKNIQEFHFIPFPKNIHVLIQKIDIYGHSNIVIHENITNKDIFSINAFLESRISIWRNVCLDIIPEYKEIQINCESKSFIDFKNIHVCDVVIKCRDKSNIFNLRINRKIKFLQDSFNITLHNVIISNETEVFAPTYITNKLIVEGSEELDNSMGINKEDIIKKQNERMDEFERSNNFSDDIKNSLREQIKINNDAYRDGITSEELYIEMMDQVIKDFTPSPSSLYPSLEDQIMFGMSGNSPQNDNWGEVTVLNPIGVSLQQNEQRRRTEHVQIGPNNFLNLIHTMPPGFHIIGAGLSSNTLGMLRLHNGDIPRAALQMPDNYTPAPPTQQGSAPEIIPITKKIKESDFDKKNVLDKLGKCIACMENRPSMMCNNGHVSMCRDCQLQNIKTGNLSCNNCKIQANYVELKYPDKKNMHCHMCKTNFCSTSCVMGCITLCTKCVNNRIDQEKFECLHCNGIGRYIIISPQGLEE